MAEYEREYMQEHCIDVYFSFGDRPFHALTYGTIIPAALNDVDRNRKIQHQVAVDMDGIRNVDAAHIEQSYVTAIREATAQLVEDVELIPDEETIVQLFKPAAELGFYSYDCIEELEDGRGLYRLVASPGIGNVARVYDDMPDFDRIDVVEFDEQRNLII